MSVHFWRLQTLMWHSSHMPPRVLYIHLPCFQQRAEPCFHRCWRICHSFWHGLVSSYPWIHQYVTSRCWRWRTKWSMKVDFLFFFFGPDAESAWNAYLVGLDIARSQRSDRFFRALRCWCYFLRYDGCISKITNLLAHGTLSNLQLYISLVILFRIWFY